MNEFTNDHQKDLETLRYKQLMGKINELDNIIDAMTMQIHSMKDVIKLQQKKIERLERFKDWAKSNINDLWGNLE